LIIFDLIIHLPDITFLIILIDFDIISLESKGMFKHSLIFYNAHISLTTFSFMESDEIMRKYI